MTHTEPEAVEPPRQTLKGHGPKSRNTGQAAAKNGRKRGKASPLELWREQGSGTSRFQLSERESRLLAPRTVRK